MQALTGGVGVGYETDLWSFGCVIYQMLAGEPPFKAGSEYLTFEKILALDYRMPEYFSEAAQSIVQSLLLSTPNARLGMSHLHTQRFHNSPRAEDAAHRFDFCKGLSQVSFCVDGEDGI